MANHEPDVVLTAEQFQQLLANVSKKPYDEEDVLKLKLSYRFQLFAWEDKGWIGFKKELPVGSILQRKRDLQSRSCRVCS